MPQASATPSIKLRELIRSHPGSADKGRAGWRLADFEASLQPSDRALLTEPAVRALLAAIADHSPFLWRLIDSEPARLIEILDDDPHRLLDKTLSDLAASTADDGEESLMARLRKTRQMVALIVALADLGGAWSVEEVIQALSEAADVYITTTVDYLLRQAHRDGQLDLDPADIAKGCGLTVLALGKLGGRELNYSSDVDLICLFDPECLAVKHPSGVQRLYVRIVRDLVRLLQHPTGDGHVLRVDLRLRPEPSAKAIAVSIPAALAYYEGFGQNWERAAMIKARPIAGDRTLGAEFIASLAPFIWRKYFDFAAIADIHAMKRQIHAAKGGDKIAVAGHNVKLGRGGIRDIEFFVQAQQLIFGGKQPALRGSRTVPVLHQLREEGHVSTEAETELAKAYSFLRGVEHRLQMLDDHQTHTIPTDKEGLWRFSIFCGYPSIVGFSSAFEKCCRTVEFHYARLFEAAQKPVQGKDTLVFTDRADDPDTLEALRKLGFRHSETVSATVRRWHAGLRPAVQSTRARERLTELVPHLLTSFARGSDPDTAVEGFDRMLERLPTATELFAILTANAALRTLFGEILGGAPRLAEKIATHPHLLDIAIDREAVVTFDEDELTTRFATVLSRQLMTEEMLDLARDYHREEHFLVGTHLLAGDLTPQDAGIAYSALATATIRALLHHAEIACAGEFGRIDGATFAVLAFGKLGSREMTAASDLDLVVVYDFDPEHPMSDGPKKLDASVYFARLTQRLITYLAAPTRRGRLYEVDMRLRPSGRSGPVATKFSAFAAYQKTTAATWEHLALTRARVIAGDPGLGAKIEASITEVFNDTKRDTMLADVAEMRALMERERPPTNDWDLKRLPGGLIDGEFLAQAIALESPALRATSPQVILLRASEAGMIAKGCAEAYGLLTAANQIMRLALPDNGTPESAGRGLKKSLAKACGVSAWRAIRPAITEARRILRIAFEDKIIANER